jgi:hypothetical protein
MRRKKLDNSPLPYIMSLTGDARYTPLMLESMLPFWYLVGSAILISWCAIDLVFDRKMLQLVCDQNSQLLICAVAP